MISTEDFTRMAEAHGFILTLNEKKPRYYRLLSHRLVVNWWFESRKQTVTVQYEDQCYRHTAATPDDMIKLALEYRAKVRGLVEAPAKPKPDPIDNLALLNAQKKLKALRAEPLPPDQPPTQAEAIRKFGANKLTFERWEVIRTRAYAKGMGETYQLVRYIEAMKVEPKR